MAPILTKPEEGRKTKAISPQPAAARKTSRTGLASLKPAGGSFSSSSSFLSFFFLIPTSETIKPGAVKGPDLEPKRGHPNNWESETNFTLLLHRTCKLLYIFIIIFLKFYCCLITFVCIFFFYILFYRFFKKILIFNFLHLVCWIALFDLFPLFSLS